MGNEYTMPEKEAMELLATCHADLKTALRNVLLAEALEDDIKGYAARTGRAISDTSVKQAALQSVREGTFDRTQPYWAYIKDIVLSAKALGSTETDT